MIKLEIVAQEQDLFTVRIRTESGGGRGSGSSDLSFLLLHNLSRLPKVNQSKEPVHVTFQGDIDSFYTDAVRTLLGQYAQANGVDVTYEHTTISKS